MQTICILETEDGISWQEFVNERNIVEDWWKNKRDKPLSLPPKFHLRIEKIPDRNVILKVLDHFKK